MTKRFDKVSAIIGAETADLKELARIAGADPRYFYCGANLDGADLRGMDLVGMEFHGASLVGVKIDATTKVDWPQLRQIVENEKWTKARDDELTALWRSGFSASAIAHQIGFASRNEVMGRVHKLRLSGKALGRTLAIFDGERVPEQHLKSLERVLSRLKLRIKEAERHYWTPNEWTAFFSIRSNGKALPRHALEVVGYRNILLVEIHGPDAVEKLREAVNDTHSRSVLNRCLYCSYDKYDAETDLSATFNNHVRIGRPVKKRATKRRILPLTKDTRPLGKPQ